MGNCHTKPVNVRVTEPTKLAALTVPKANDLHRKLGKESRCAITAEDALFLDACIEDADRGRLLSALERVKELQDDMKRKGVLFLFVSWSWRCCRSARRVC
jgi:hypothetical protein